jgi:hypothetical protein
VAPAVVTEQQFSLLMTVAGAIIAGAGGYFSSRVQARMQALSAGRATYTGAQKDLYEAFEKRVENLERAIDRCEERCEKQIAQLDQQRIQIRDLTVQNMQQASEMAELKRQNAIQAVKIAHIEKKTEG